jgi:hypothetical protein
LTSLQEMITPVFGKSASQQDMTKYEAAAVKAVQNKDQFDFTSISGDIKPSEKEATKLPQIIKKIAQPDPQPKTAGINLLLYYRFNITTDLFIYF